MSETENQKQGTESSENQDQTDAKRQKKDRAGKSKYDTSSDEEDGEEDHEYLGCAKKPKSDVQIVVKNSSLTPVTLKANSLNHTKIVKFKEHIEMLILSKVDPDRNNLIEKQARTLISEQFLCESTIDEISTIANMDAWLQWEDEKLFRCLLLCNPVSSNTQATQCGTLQEQLLKIKFSFDIKNYTSCNTYFALLGEVEVAKTEEQTAEEEARTVKELIKHITGPLGTSEVKLLWA
jgi:hypothetical protein